MKLTLIFLSIVVLLAACSPDTATPNLVIAPPTVEEPQVSEPTPDWKTIPLHDVNSDTTFTINQFKGSTILVESFAIWCPTCTKQQKTMKELAALDDSLIHVSLDTDPNEDEAAVKLHAVSNGFDWYYAVAPIEATQSLINEFGISVVNAPSSPVILVCEDQSTRLLSRGLKSVEELQEEIATGC